MSQITHLHARRVFAVAPKYCIEITVHLSKQPSVSAMVYLDLQPCLGKSQVQSELSRIINILTADLSALLAGMDTRQQAYIDDMLTAFLQQQALQNHVAPIAFAISSAITKADAKINALPLPSYLSQMMPKRPPSKQFKPPMVMVNLLSGGLIRHWRGCDFAEILAVPVGAKSVLQGITWCQQVQQAVTENLFKTSTFNNGSIDVETLLDGNFQALALCQQSIFDAGLDEQDMMLAVNVDAPQFFINGEYVLRNEQQTFSQTDLVAYYQQMLQRFPIIYLQNAFVDNNDLGWQQLLQGVRNRVWPLAAAHLEQEVCSASQFKKRLKQQTINTLVITPNKTGDLGQISHYISRAQQANKQVVINVPEQQVFDEMLVALAIAWRVPFIKLPALTSAEHVRHCNQLEQYACQAKKTVAKLPLRSSKSDNKVIAYFL
ncbi:hypothetical protein [Motilimonas pumila]|uniref:Enolase n=1 Tax=Motilimonas pumila TaxID=2303987 RepID=A0A418YKF8_9GAMM|nr:hypothetical protein [Motilimonas pumila]RJG51461.1 hypothetical protein D1Z90_01640 [Motilimonas pumila]